MYKYQNDICQLTYKYQNDICQLYYLCIILIYDLFVRTTKNRSGIQQKVIYRLFMFDFVLIKI